MRPWCRLGLQRRHRQFAPRTSCPAAACAYRSATTSACWTPTCWVKPPSTRPSGAVIAQPTRVGAGYEKRLGGEAKRLGDEACGRLSWRWHGDAQPPMSIGSADAVPHGTRACCDAALLVDLVDQDAGFQGRTTISRVPNPPGFVGLESVLRCLAWASTPRPTPGRLRGWLLGNGQRIRSRSASSHGAQTNHHAIPVRLPRHRLATKWAFTSVSGISGAGRQASLRAEPRSWAQLRGCVLTHQTIPVECALVACGSKLAASTSGR